MVRAAAHLVRFCQHTFERNELLREDFILSGDLPELDDLQSYMSFDSFHIKYLLTALAYRFSDEYTNAHFAKLDVDEVPDVAQDLGIRAMPTFIIFKDGEKFKEIVGANPVALKQAIDASVVEEDKQ